MTTDSPALHTAGDWSFKIATGTPADLVRWLQSRAYHLVKTQTIEPRFHRLERPAPAHERAVILIFATGTVLLQGHAEPREAARLLLTDLVVEPEATAEQLVLFAEVA